MNILIANDDGIDSPGLAALVNALKDEYDLYVAAPMSQRSAFSHSVTYFYKKNRAEKREIEGAKEAYAIDGTPADCTYYGLNGLFSVPMDLVISGINIGRNMASDIIYSGTVAAAAEALIASLPAIAVSLCSHAGGDFTVSARTVKQIIPAYMEHPEKSSFLLNVNVPDLDEKKIRGIRITGVHGHVDYGRPVEKEIRDGQLWLSIEDDGMIDSANRHEQISDVEAVSTGYISVTPLDYDLCARSIIPTLSEIEAAGK